MSNITPFLWFDGNAEAAVQLYTSIFPNSSIGVMLKLPDGQVLTVSFTLNGTHFTALNGGPQFKFTEAISFVITCRDQQEIDYYWDRLTANGGEAGMCGWLKDPFGLSWQVVPQGLGQLLGNPDPDKAARTSQALMQMRKLDIAALEQA